MKERHLKDEMQDRHAARMVFQEGFSPLRILAEQVTYLLEPLAGEWISGLAHLVSGSIRETFPQAGSHITREGP